MSTTNDLLNAAFPKGALFPLPWFGGFVASSPVIPQLYWDVYSAEQRWKTICCDLKKLVEYANQQSLNINVNHEDIEALEQMFEDFKASGFDEYYEEQVKAWIDENLRFVFENTAKQLYFGLNEQGYFVAYVPESWDQIIFDTGADYSKDTYGRLILRYDVLPEQPETVDQTPETTDEKPHGAVGRI